MFRMNRLLVVILGISLAVSCGQKEKQVAEEKEDVFATDNLVIIEAEDFLESGSAEVAKNEKATFVTVGADGWLSYDVDFKIPGRYRTEIFASSDNEGGVVWLEDYIDNKDQRTYNVTGSIVIQPNDQFQSFYVNGSPFNNIGHKMKLHVNVAEVHIDKIVFTLLKEHQTTPVTYTQKMDGEDWNLVWSDEFEGTQIDTTKWIYDFGNWGWGNNELQYYTDSRAENARIEDGNLIIEARKDDDGIPWTSARLTTRGKESFLYGKIELKAIVPREKGNWAAGWTLGDSYLDELSWPYCGEIDILESVGYEVDNESGDGIAHVTVHTPAYYFKINNQISSTKDINNIAGEFHTYSVEWTPEEVRGYVDGEQYYVYKENANDREWPFNEPQNIILNLAMGGGWGGAMGMDSTVTSQKFILDYVRVYELQ